MVDIDIEIDFSELEELKKALRTGEGIVQFLAPHAIYVEYPTNYRNEKPPVEPLIAWVRINLNVDDPKSVAFAIREKLYKKGTEGVFFANNTFDEYSRGKAQAIAQRYEGSDDPAAPRKIVEEILEESLEDAEQRIEEADAISTGYLKGSGVYTLGVDADTEEVNFTQIT